MPRNLILCLWSLILCLCGANTLAQERLYTSSFPLQDVKLLQSPFKSACDLNVKTLLAYDVDRLLAPFRKEAGLQSKAESFPNWIDLDGHIGGHYLSAVAISYAATGNKALKARMDYIISELKQCQATLGTGYVGGVPNSKYVWGEVSKGNVAVVWKSWVPWYNLHKTYAGLRDAWNYGGNVEAREMFLSLCDWGITIINSLSDEQMEAMLANEFGGMNEVYADAFQMTGNSKYLSIAKRFSHREIFNSMRKRVDNLDNKHANTQVPKAVGYQRVAETTGDGEFARAADFFWETVSRSRSLSMGGNSRREHFPSQEDCVSYTEEREGPETCNTNNMLKLTEGLFRMKPEAQYADFYEKAMLNHILSSQHPSHGGFVYFTSVRPRHYRVYSAPNSAMWCCVGTGMENHGKYGEFIYSHRSDSLYVNLFIASELLWKEKDVVISQKTRFPDEEGSLLVIKTKRPVRFKLLVRHPGWVASDDMSVLAGGREYAIKSRPTSYIEIEREWHNGDVVRIKTPMRNTVEEMPNVPSYISVLHGPVLLAAKTGIEDLHGLIAGDDRWAHIAAGKLLSLTSAPVSVGTRADIKSKIERMHPVKGTSLQYTIPDLFVQREYKNLVFEPFFRIHDSRYIIYWPSLTKAEYDDYQKARLKLEEERMLLERRIVDKVSPAEQQPEVDHQMQTNQSNSGYFKQEGFRDAHGSSGFFSYNLLTQQHTALNLMVRYWGNEIGKRSFDIFIDDKLLVSENISNKWNKDSFVNVEYNIPVGMLIGKSSITVSFRSKTENTAGGVYKVLLLKQHAE